MTAFRRILCILAMATGSIAAGFAAMVLAGLHQPFMDRIAALAGLAVALGVMFAAMRQLMGDE